MPPVSLIARPFSGVCANEHSQADEHAGSAPGRIGTGPDRHRAVADEELKRSVGRSAASACMRGCVTVALLYYAPA
jgi:hypothetical protein